ncbi:MAG: AAA family ATPase [Pseudomonadota bacterium]|nr:AAA family ATPase [Pseudomonadota bacterium]
MEDELEPLKVAAERFGVTYERLRRAAYDGRLTVARKGYERMVRPSEVRRFLHDGGRRPQPATISFAATEEGEGTKMARTICITAPKGGVGKSTTALNLGAALAECGQRVLLVDLDPQGSLTRITGHEPEALERTIYTAFKHFLGYYELTELPILRLPAGVDIVPSNSVFTAAEDELLTAVRREAVLQQLLEPYKQLYDTILIDTAPSLGVLVQNALVASQAVIIPLEAEYLATPSIPLILKKIQVTRRTGLNERLAIAGILITMTDDRNIMSRETVAYIRQTFGEHVPIFETMIKRLVQFPNSQAAHQSILQYEPQGEGSRAYRALAEEVLHAV